jgi:L-iditol 2-dehydrogenase
LKGVEALETRPGDTVLVQGQGPIGLLFTRILALRGCRVVSTDTIASRLALARRMGATEAWDPRSTDVSSAVKRVTNGRGADSVVSATAAKGLVEEAVRASRPGARILLFAQTSDKERIELSGADICVGERVLLGSYSASVKLQKESASLVFSGDLRVEELISHRLPLGEFERGVDLALHPDAKSLKIIVQPQRLL